MLCFRKSKLPAEIILISDTIGHLQLPQRSDTALRLDARSPDREATFPVLCVWRLTNTGSRHPRPLLLGILYKW